MKIPALRSIDKINSNVLQNFRRLFSYRFEMTPATRPATEQSEEAAKPPEVSDDSKKTNFRYNVCQPRTTTLERPRIGDIDNHQDQVVKTAIEQQQLQPAMLPEYFQRQMEKNVLVNPDPEPSEEMKISQRHSNTQNYRKFQESKTCANVTLPLKSMKLANPFPEPVKMMPSRTVADDEKAEQMLADAKSQIGLSNSTNQSASNFHQPMTEIKRWYSKKTVHKDPSRCKRVGKPKSICPKMTAPCCPPRARTKCDRLAKSKLCKKQDAPYPAYSEFCHEDIEEKPSECKLCPWKAEDNPNFKPQKKNVHTAANPMMLRRSGLEMECQKKEGGEESPDAMQCDLRKPKCERPKNRRCPLTKEEKKKEEEEKRKPTKKCNPFTELVEGTPVPGEEIQTLLASETDKCKKVKEKCKKFKFPAEKIEEKSEQGCPKKKRKPKIKDCPGPCGGGCKQTLGQSSEEYSLSGDFEDTQNRKCPYIDMTVDKEVMEDRCKKRRPEGTLKCPADLLKKKQRRKKPKHKTSGVLTPVESKVDMPQPTKRV